MLHTHSTHLPSVASHSELISCRIVEEVTAGTLVTPLPGSPPVCLSPIGIIPKPHQPGKFRLIVDLSSPYEASINDAILPELAFLHYPRVDQTATLIAQHSRGVLIAKLDLHSAYCKIPVHPNDGMLLGISIYIDRALGLLDFVPPLSYSLRSRIGMPGP